MGDYERKDFTNYLKNQIGESLVLIIKSGVGCCKQQGILCNIKDDLAILINQNLKIEVPLAGVVAVKKRTTGLKNL